MNKNIKFKGILIILLIAIGILSFKLFFVVYKINCNKNQGVVNMKVNEKVNTVERYGYSDILDSLSKDSDFTVKSINMTEEDKCNIQVDYSGDIKLLYTSLYNLNESKNLLNINSININNQDKITTINVDFKKNK